MWQAMKQSNVVSKGVMRRSQVARSAAERPSAVSTPERIIEAAGQIFAEKGFLAATGKEISQRAEANNAAINYHFGGLEALYREAIRVAQERLLAAGSYADELPSGRSLDERLLALCEMMIRSLHLGAGEGWEMHLLSREAFTPSGVLDLSQSDLLVRRIRVLSEVVSEGLDRPAVDPTVVQTCLTIMAPVILIQVSELASIGKSFGDFRIEEDRIDEIIRLFFTFVKSGIAGVARLSLDDLPRRDD